MNKKDLVDTLSRSLVTRREAQKVVNLVFDEMAKAVLAGDKVVISGFGTFLPVFVRAKKVRNPKTGRMVDAPQRKKLRFRQAKGFFTTV